MTGEGGPAGLQGRQPLRLRFLPLRVLAAPRPSVQFRVPDRRPRPRSRPSRLRRALKWSGLAACVLLVGLWGFSWWRWVWWNSASSVPMYRAGLYDGLFAVSHHGVPVYANALALPGTRGVNYDRPHRPLAQRWTPCLVDERGTPFPSLAIGVPLWIPTLLIATPTALLWWRDRRGFGRACCPRCGYDLAGLAKGAPCPECGGTAA